MPAEIRGELVEVQGVHDAIAIEIALRPGSASAVEVAGESGEIRETFRTLRRRAGAKPLRAFAFLEIEGEDEAAEEVDLAKLGAENDRG